MKNQADGVTENCNYCAFRQNMSQHWDVEDYCQLNMKRTSKIKMGADCYASKTEDKDRI